MKSFKEWFKEQYNEEVPEGDIPSTWFAEHGLPMVVACTNCGTTMVVLSAQIDDDEYVYCADCAG